MSRKMENAELYSLPDEASMRLTLKTWLILHNVNFTDEMTTEELRQLYIKKEIGEI